MNFKTITPEEYENQGRDLTYEDLRKAVEAKNVNLIKYFIERTEKSYIVKILFEKKSTIIDILSFLNKVDIEIDSNVVHLILSKSENFELDEIKEFLNNIDMDILSDVVSKIMKKENFTINNYIIEFLIVNSFVSVEQIESKLNLYEDYSSILYLFSDEFNLINSVFSFNYLRSRYYFNKIDYEDIKQLFSDFTNYNSEKYNEEEFGNFILLFSEQPYITIDEILEILISNIENYDILNFIVLFPDYEFGNEILKTLIEYCDIENLHKILDLYPNMKIDNKMIDDISKLKPKNENYYEMIAFLIKKGFKVEKFLFTDGDTDILHDRYGIEYSEIYDT